MAPYHLASNSMGSIGIAGIVLYLGSSNRLHVVVAVNIIQLCVVEVCLRKIIIKPSGILPEVWALDKSPVLI